MELKWNNHGNAFQVSRVIICNKRSDYLGIILESLETLLNVLWKSPGNKLELLWK